MKSILSKVSFELTSHQTSPEMNCVYPRPSYFIRPCLPASTVVTHSINDDGRRPTVVGRHPAGNRRVLVSLGALAVTFYGFNSTVEIGARWNGGMVSSVEYVRWFSNCRQSV